MRKLILLFLLLSNVLYARAHQVSEDYVKNEKTLGSGTMVYIYCIDGIQYAYVQRGYSGGLSVMLDKYGKPIMCEVPNG